MLNKANCLLSEFIALPLVMKSPCSSRSIRVLLFAGCASLAAGGSLRAGSDSAPNATVQDTRPLTVQMDDYLKTQHVEHAIDAPTASNGQTTTVKIYGVGIAAQQETLCAGLSAGEKHDRLQGVSVQFLMPDTHAAGNVQTFQPSSLPSGNGSVTTMQRPVEKTDYRLQRTVKLQELVSK